jgi:predicted  nucleic acid-binding Zn-ribbon protein
MMIDNGEWAVDAAMAERAEKDARRSEHARCKHCGHAKYAHAQNSMTLCKECVACGCIRFEARAPKDPALQPLWAVEAKFLTVKGWLHGTTRVRAAGRGGALVKGERDIKRRTVPRGKQVRQAVVTVTRVRG